MACPPPVSDPRPTGYFGDDDSDCELDIETKPIGVHARQATIDDWGGIQACITRLANSRFAKFVSCSKEEAQNWFFSSQSFPQQFGFLVVVYGGQVCGIAALMAIDVPTPTARGVASGGRHCFIHSCYIDPWVPRVSDGDPRLAVPADAGFAMNQAVEFWARRRGCCYAYGNCREELHFDALFRKHGYSKVHIVVGKVLK